MNLQEQICNAFCSEINVREVPLGFAVSAPFNWLSGDKILFYARRNGSSVRIEDSGSTIFDLETAGVALNSTNRAEIIENLQNEYGILFDDHEVVFHTGWLDQSLVGAASIRLLAFLHRLQDLLFLSQNRVASTFKEDLAKAIEERFRGIASITFDDAPSQKLSYYTADICIRDKDGKTTAVFAGTSDYKVLDAVLYSKELELHHIDNVIPFLIYENATPAKISRDAQKKALNSELKLAAWEGGQVEVINKIAKHVANAA